MKKNEFLSIKDFSELAGVSNQAVYKRLNNKLKKYVNVENGKKTINCKALELYQLKENLNVEQQIEQQLNNGLKTALSDTITLLSKQLEEKDKQIAEKDKQISALNDHLQQSQRLNENNQVLIGRQQDQPKQIIEDLSTQEKKSPWSRFFKKEK